MQLSGRLRTMIGVLCGLVLISVAVIATQGSQQAAPATVATHVEQAHCTGDCATCPNARTEPCPPGEAAETTSSDASVDADRCIGCVRCVNVAPEAFQMNPETRKAEVIDGAPADSIALGARACPVDAITQ